MTFTVVFQSTVKNLSYMLAFEPCPIWKKRNECLINLNPSTPYYQLGSIKKLIEREKLDGLIESKECVLIIQQDGHGSPQDLNNLELDLQQEGFNYSVCSFPTQ